MTRQLWAVILLSTLLSLFGSLLASLWSAQSYLSEQLTLKNTDNATALALSISQGDPDPVKMELLVSALFDSGQYQLIRIVDPYGKTIVERSNEQPIDGVPGWFVSVLPVEGFLGSARISSGWRQVGTIYIQSESRFAYRQLWKSASRTVLFLSLTGLIACLLASLVLRRLLPPLSAVVDQAKGIMERRFFTIAPPKVPELKRLADAMNVMVTRLQDMFAEEGARLEAVRREANTDAVTGLSNRTHFLAVLNSRLGGEEAHDGTVVFVRIKDLAGINRTLGRAATDNLLKGIGQSIATRTAALPGSLGARMNGADFAILLGEDVDAVAMSESIASSAVDIAKSCGADEPDILRFGLAPFGAGMQTGAVLALADHALATAEATGHVEISESTATLRRAPQGEEQWRGILANAIQQGWTQLAEFPLVTWDRTLIHLECPLRLKFSAEGEWETAGRFIPMAERLRMTPALDLAAVEAGLKMLGARPDVPGVGINLSVQSLADEHFGKSLVALISRFRGVAPRLWLEVPEQAALLDVKALLDICVRLREFKCRLGLEHFGRELGKIPKLEALGLAYLKVDGSFVSGIESSPGNQSFLRGLCQIAHAIGLKVYAEGVRTDAEFRALQELSLDGATGPGVRIG
jgi:EAL domain-containing protein (putative c-di-GMP-specific phosphodiesterase class I)/GGDEF domain-containing protein